MTKKRTAKIVPVTPMGATFNMTAVADVTVTGNNAEAAVLDGLLGDLLPQGDDASDEHIEVLADDEVTGDVQGADMADEIIESSANAADALLDEIHEDAEQIAARQAVYAAQQGTAGDDGSAPETPVEVVEPTTDKAAQKAAKKAERDAARAKKKEERDAAKAAKPAVAPRATSITHKPGALLVAKLGKDARDYLSFSLNDVATLDTVALEAKQDEFIARMDDRDAIADKVKEKMTMLLTWLQKGGTADDLNEVLRRTFRVLAAKGELTSGDKGNLQLDLLAKPYSMGTARSQSNQMFMALPELGITLKEKGRMVANPDSVLLPMINAKLGL